MGLSNVEVIKGLGSFVISKYGSAVPKYILQSANNIKVTPKTEKDQLVNARGVLDEDIRSTSYELSFEAYEYPASVIEHLSGGIKTTYDAEDDGEIVDIENVYGDSVYDVATGCVPSIDTDALVPEEEGAEAVGIKYGEYVVEAVTASTVKVYALGDVSFRDGVDADFQDDSLCITEDDLTIATGTEVIVEGFGIALTGGSGTIALTPGDTMRFRVRRPEKAGFKVSIGGLTEEYETVSAIAFPKKKNDKFYAVKLHKFIIQGLPIEIGDNYSKYEVTATLQYDSGKRGVMEFIKE